MKLNTGEFALGQMLALVTVPLTDKARFNFNVGWSYLDASPGLHAVRSVSCYPPRNGHKAVPL